MLHGDLVPYWRRQIFCFYKRRIESVFLSGREKVFSLANLCKFGVVFARKITIFPPLSCVYWIPIDSICVRARVCTCMRVFFYDFFFNFIYIHIFHLSSFRFGMPNECCLFLYIYIYLFYLSPLVERNQMAQWLIYIQANEIRRRLLIFQSSFFFFFFFFFFHVVCWLDCFWYMSYVSGWSLDCRWGNGLRLSSN